MGVVTGGSQTMGVVTGGGGGSDLHSVQAHSTGAQNSTGHSKKYGRDLHAPAVRSLVIRAHSQ
jgi:hypothetical protein